MSNEVLEHGVPFERAEVTTESPGRNWSQIGVGLAAAFAVVAMYTAAIWAVLVLFEALV